MVRKNISSGSQYEASIGFSRAVRIGKLISVSGTAPIAEDGKTAFPGDLYNQTKRCIDIMVKAIIEAGGKKEDIIRTRIYLKNVGEWGEAAKAHGEYFSKIRPACTFIGVKGLIDPEWLVETEADCVIKALEIS
ncbi:enamine deaminase RidA (YjgF/YER057c/UK114 family) [Winogradskyella epiphytica]|uniref:Enamine deaminase RidA (YjgF/YER057c/UK114 family) n=1 Tax=Winogradskyella epiphytica TaxID=262005 RepID=A0A2V4WTD0_9FLAO|nr:RidA family protein [Winogradskyella epiphytica]PYE79617.1 enamine deaminase RidA (YjgF/YER057c/UK114 family) [Winogradskyella epiphytica]GGW73845.1 hypothetical protein GCM10008085_27630 [Winogradskyella epiphytica]